MLPKSQNPFCAVAEACDPPDDPLFSRWRAATHLATRTRDAVEKGQDTARHSLALQNRQKRLPSEMEGEAELSRDLAGINSASRRLALHKCAILFSARIRKSEVRFDPNGAKISPGSPQARPPLIVLPSKMEGEATLSR